MSTKWGFDLDMAAVRLMRREGADWREIAVEKIDGADIEDRLLAMVEQIDGDAPVELFLPRDQILYTDVEVSSNTHAAAEIDLAMAGRTPYPREELDLDWEMTAPNTARVAAIALETLDEAAAFAEVRNLPVGGFSSLAEPEDFPRNPDFTSHSIFDEDPGGSDETEEIPVQFVTARQPSRPPPPAAPDVPAEAIPAASDPVIRVEDTTPVMQVNAPPEAPLNPGRPISAPSAPPRVRTDIAAASVSDHVASLAPTASVKVHRQGPSILRTAAIFAVAFLLTVGIAMLVWKLLPLGPGSAPIQPVTEATTPSDGQSALEPAPETPEKTDIAALPETDDLPDLPQPSAARSVSDLAALETDDIPQIATLDEQPLIVEAPRLVSALRSGEGLPAYDPSVPGTPSPEAFALIQTTAPFPGPDPSDEVAETTDGIYIASIERSDLSFDAIALPSVQGLSADALPQPAPPPEIDPATTEIAGIDASTAVEEALADLIEVPGEGDPASEVETSNPGLPRPTTFAAALPDTSPSQRPVKFVEAIERQRFGGRSRSELAELKPPPRPESAQTVAIRETEPAPATELAVATSLAPRGRPQDFDAIVATTIVQRDAERLTASLDYETPDTSSAIEAALESDAEPEIRPQDTPRLAIPSSASVARQATVENAIRLNKVNLVGVYGAPADRRALVRLSSGRFVKVKVGDRVDGGTVAKITDSELLYRKGNRTLSLSMPKG
ncbi:MAG: hypothetical protein HKN18_06185 [Silicimonas sp.]|nr:hypothetical protein [Silicimonas sp.]